MITNIIERTSPHFVILCMVALILAACEMSSTDPTSRADNGNRPNFLVLFTDDQRWDTVSYFAQIAESFPGLQTPNLDQLALDGVVFNRAFATTPICVSSRANLATGMYTRNHRVQYFHDQIPDDVFGNTYHRQLKDAGYLIGVLGKWGMGINQTSVKTFHMYHAWQGQGAPFRNVNGEQVHVAQWMTDEAGRFFEAARMINKPFVLTLNYKVPHQSSDPDPRDEYLFQDIVYPRMQTDTPAHFHKLPEPVKKSQNRYLYNRNGKNEQRFQDQLRKYAQKLVSLDRSVGLIVNKLKAAGLYDNTVIIFASDHGTLFGEHGLMAKYLLYEESIRIPLIIHDPRVEKQRKGAELDDLVLLIDIAPTILSMAGIEVPPAMDGQDLTPLIYGLATEWRDDFFMEHNSAIARVSMPIRRNDGIRSKDFKYIQYTDADLVWGNGEDPLYEEFFDLRNDPQEENNLIANSAYSETIDFYRNRLKQYRSEHPQTYKLRTYSNRNHSGASSLDLNLFAQAKPDIYAKLVSKLKRRNVTIEQVTADQNLRFEICDEINYWF